MSAGAEHSMMFFSYRSLQHIFLSRVCVRVCFLFLDFLFFFVVVLLLLATHLIFAFLWAPENRHIGGVFAFFWLLEQKNTVNTDDFCASEAQNHDLWCFLMFFASGSKSHSIYKGFWHAPSKNTGIYAVFSMSQEMQEDFPKAQKH